MIPSALILSLLANAAQPAADAVYRLALDAALSRATVELCLRRWPQPPRLVSQHREAERFRSPARVTRGELEILESDHGIRLSGVDDDECIAYDVDLDRLEREGGERALHRAGESIITSSGLWLWRPAGGFADRRVDLTLDLPDGMEASLPWAPAGDGSSRYRLTPTPRDWDDLTAFGRLSSREVAVPGARLRLAIADTTPPADAADVASWIGEAARAVGTLYGRFPLTTAQVVVVPIGRRSEAVPWAQVQRGGGPAAHFYIDQHRPLKEFRDDWTATHELSHMLLPFVARRDAWLSEGFASYYQNVLRARAGMITPAQAWEKLYAGFGRGRDGTRGDTLAEVSREMYRRGAFMRVYWSGAAIALLADVELRQASGGRTSLDVALRQLAECCLPSHRTWTAREVLTRLDELTGTQVFMGLYAHHIDSPRFPDVGGASAALGIVEDADGLAFSADRTATALRRAIMSTPAAALAASGYPEHDGHDPTTGATAQTGNGGGPRGPTP